MLDWGTKAAGEIIVVRWQPTLATGDELESFTCVALAPATTLVDDTSYSATEGTATISGGAVEEIAYFQLEGTTASGETLQEVGRLTIVDEAIGDVVTPGELRGELRDCMDADEVLADLIATAREYVETETGSISLAREVVVVLDGWPTGNVSGWWDGVREGPIGGGDAPNWIELPRMPALSITSVETLDSNGQPTTWAAGNYYLDNRSDTHRLILKPGASWPVPGVPAAGIIITYQAGYDDPAKVPQMFKRCVLQLAAHWYENRELASADATNRVHFMARELLEKLKVRRL